MTAALPGTAVIIRPRHPLHGRELRVLGRMRRHGVRELLVEIPDGSKRLIPASWTDLDQAAGAEEGDAPGPAGASGDDAAGPAHRQGGGRGRRGIGGRR